MSAEWRQIKLEDALGYVQPTKFIVKSTAYDDSYQTPVLTPGKSFLLGFTDETDGIYHNIPTIIFDDFTTEFKFVDFPFKVKSSAMKMLELKSDDYDMKFLYYLMLTLRFNASEHKRYWISKYSKQNVNVPSLAEQKQIAAILDAADSLRQKDQQLVEHYTALSQSLFLEMFGDDDQFPSMSAGEVIDIRDGTHDSPKYVDEGFPLITSKNIKNGDLDFSSLNFISQADYDQIQKRSAASIGDIIMPMIGTIGNPHLIIKQPNYAIKNVALFKFHESDQVKNVFIYYLLNSQHFERYVASKNKGGTQKFISLGDLRKMPIVVPPVTLQNQFAERVAIIEKQKQQAQANLQKSEALFNSLLQRAFTGELTADRAA